MSTLTALTQSTTLAGTDVFYYVDGADSRKIPFSAILDAVEAQGAAPTTFITSGTFADARVAASNVTQHQASLSITESQISDFGTYQVQLAEGAFVDGDKTKLDGIEASADVTDTANVTAAGAIMDSEVTNLAQVKAFNSADYATSAQGTLADSAVQPGDDADTLGSGAATDGQVLTADGIGGAAWEAVPAGGTVDVLSNVATNTIVGRVAAGSGDSEELTATQVRTLINVEDGADVTDTANVTSAGALMDSEVTNLAAVKAFDPADYQDVLTEGAFVDGDKTKLDGIESGADVTDTANVTAAGALMDSELTDLAGVKALDTSTLAGLGANTFTGTQDFNGQQVEGTLNKVVATVSGALTTTAHSGNVLETSGNVTVPTTAGFNCVLIAGGAHTVTFNATTSAAMAAGDLMTIIVEDGTTIHAVLTAAADKVSFT